MSKENTLARYLPGVPPTVAEELPIYIQGNLSSIASMVNSPMKNFAPLNEAPLKPREGDIAFANGSSWDPGYGRGLYMYNGIEWISAAAASGGGAIPIGGIIIWTGSVVPPLWTLCDGTAAPNGMPCPDLQSRFLKGAGTVAVGTIGGSTNTGSTASGLPAHSHSGPSHTHTGPSHTHTGPVHHHAGPNHTHTGPSHTHSGPSHTHAQLGTFNSNQSGDHLHGILAGASVRTDAVQFHFEPGGTLGNYPTSPSPFWESSGDHLHSTTISGPTGHTAGTTGSGGTGNTSDAGNGATGSGGDGNTGSGGTGNTGSGGTGETGGSGTNSSHNHTMDPIYYAVAYIMRYE